MEEVVLPFFPPDYFPEECFIPELPNIPAEPFTFLKEWD
jgi:hypothetical protein